jgi:hypothetical protein
VTDAAKNSSDINIIGYAPPCSSCDAQPEVKLRSDIVSASLVPDKGEFPLSEVRMGASRKG